MLRQYLFCLPGTRAFLLAGVREGDRFSIVTTKPNASVAPIHDHIPPVLEPEESNMRLDPDFADLASRNSISIYSEAEP